MDPLRADYKYTNISTATSTQVATGNCTLVRIIVNTTAAGTISIYNNTGTDTTNPIGILKASIVEGNYEYGIRLSEGLKIVTAQASNITVVYSKN